WHPVGKPPRPRNQRRLRDILLIARPPLLAVMQGGEFFCSVPIHSHLLSVRSQFGGYGLTPATFNRIRYNPMRAVKYSVLPSESPKARFAGISGAFMVPRRLPSGDMIQTPPGPVQ